MALLYDERNPMRPIAEAPLRYQMPALRSGDAPVDEDIPAGMVTYGEWELWTLPFADESADPAVRSGQWDHYLAVVPHTLAFFDQPVREVSVTFRTRAVAYDLLPARLVATDGPTSWGLSASQHFTSSPAEAAVADLLRCGLHTPIVEAFGLRENVFGWRYRAGSGTTLVGGVRNSYVVLRVPKGVESLTVHAYAAPRDRVKGGTGAKRVFELTMPPVSPPRREGSGTRALHLGVGLAESHRLVPEQLVQQKWLLSLIAGALREVDVDPAYSLPDQLMNLVILPAGIDEPKVVPKLVRALKIGLAHTNRRLKPQIRLRAGLSAGLSFMGSTWPVGDPVNELTELFDREQPGSVLLITDHLYRELFVHEFGDLRAESFVDVGGAWAVGLD